MALRCDARIHSIHAAFVRARHSRMCRFFRGCCCACIVEGGSHNRHAQKQDVQTVVLDTDLISGVCVYSRIPIREHARICIRCVQGAFCVKTRGGPLD